MDAEKLLKYIKGGDYRGLAIDFWTQSSESKLGGIKEPDALTIVTMGIQILLGDIINKGEEDVREESVLISDLGMATSNLTAYTLALKCALKVANKPKTEGKPKPKVEQKPVYVQEGEVAFCPLCAGEMELKQKEGGKPYWACKKAISSACTGIAFISKFKKENGIEVVKKITSSFKAPEEEGFFKLE